MTIDHNTGLMYVTWPRMLAFACMIASPVLVLVGVVWNELGNRMDRLEDGLNMRYNTMLLDHSKFPHDNVAQLRDLARVERRIDGLETSVIPGVQDFARSDIQRTAMQTKELRDKDLADLSRRITELGVQLKEDMSKLEARLSASIANIKLETLPEMRKNLSDEYSRLDARINSIQQNIKPAPDATINSIRPTLKVPSRFK